MLTTQGTNPFQSQRLAGPQKLAELYEAMMKEAEKKKKKEKKKGGSGANVKSIMDGIASIAKAFGAGKGGGPKGGGGAGGPSKGGGGGGPQGGGQGGACKGCGSCSQIRPQEITTGTGKDALSGNNNLGAAGEEEKLNASGAVDGAVDGAEGGAEGAADAGLDSAGGGGGDEAGLDSVGGDSVGGGDAVDTDTSADSGPDPEPVSAE